MHGSWTLKALCKRTFTWRLRSAHTSTTYMLASHFIPFEPFLKFWLLASFIEARRQSVSSRNKDPVGSSATNQLLANCSCWPLTRSAAALNKVMSLSAPSCYLSSFLSWPHGLEGPYRKLLSALVCSWQLTGFISTSTQVLLILSNQTGMFFPWVGVKGKTVCFYQSRTSPKVC